MTTATLTRRLARYRAARETPMAASKRRQLDALIRATERRLETTMTTAESTVLIGTVNTLADTDPRRLAAILTSLIVFNPEARRFITAKLESLPAITPEAIEADERLTDDEKAQAFDLLFEYHGEDEG